MIPFVKLTPRPASPRTPASAASHRLCGRIRESLMGIVGTWAYLLLVHFWYLSDLPRVRRIRTWCAAWLPELIGTAFVGVLMFVVATILFRRHQ